MFDNALSHPGGSSYPIQHFGPTQSDDLVAFILSVDERLRAARFHRYMSPDMVRDHYRSLCWDNAVVAAWVAGGGILGVCEGHLFQSPEGLQAEVALCVEEDPRGRGIGHALMARVISAMADRGARRSVMILHRDSRAHAGIVRRLGGMVDWGREIAILRH
jgi:GNAT superfamily N-acetyltransferase